jgi:adenosylcobinamide-GDP ribazoletransferase
LSLHDLEVALAILTRLPSRLATAPGPREVEAAVHWFPLAGALVGALAGAAYLLAGTVGLPGLSALLLALAVQLLATGGLHEIGTARTVEAVAGAAGPAGEAAPTARHAATLVLCLLLLARVAALTSFWSPASLTAALVSAGAVSRAALAAVLLARSASRTLRPEPTRVGLGLGLACAIALALLPPFLAFQASLWSALAAAAVALWLVRELGSCDGNGLGTVQQAAELAFLLALAAEGWPREG